MKAKIIPVIIALLLVSGCATAHRAPRYGASYPETVVKAPIVTAAGTIAAPVAASGAPLRHTINPGETLWSISKMYNVNLEALADANNITDIGSIEKGQVLIIPKKAGVSRIISPGYARTPSRSLGFRWPVKGTIAYRFGEKVDKSINKGIDIRISEATPVVASRDGRVVYCDPYFKGFGQTVIIDHMDSYQTVYSYNSEIAVKSGDTVTQGQTIARTGQSGRAKEPLLHFEIRKNGEPVDPEKYLRR